MFARHIVTCIYMVSRTFYLFCRGESISTIWRRNDIIGGCNTIMTFYSFYVHFCKISYCIWDYILTQLFFWKDYTYYVLHCVWKYYVLNNTFKFLMSFNKINWRDVHRINVDGSSLWVPWPNKPYENKHLEQHEICRTKN